jgi:hypothetical protein
MANVFYALGILGIIWEIVCLVEVVKVHNFLLQLKVKQRSEYSLSLYTETDKSFLFLMFLYFVWAIVGLLSSQWPIFLFFILFSLIPKKNIYYRFFDALVSFSILIFILLNHFHFKINLNDYFMSFFM